MYDYVHVYIYMYSRQNIFRQSILFHGRGKVEMKEIWITLNTKLSRPTKLYLKMQSKFKYRTDLEIKIYVLGLEWTYNVKYSI